MLKEIGSEFWRPDIKHVKVSVWDKYEGSKRFYLTGRSALYAILDDVLSERTCKTAYLPDYVCHTMVEPFTMHGLMVDFYPIHVTDKGIVAVIDITHQYDIVLTVDYFGFKSSAQELPNAIHIHDVTHSLLSETTYPDADYTFASFRKWGAVAGAGIAIKNEGMWGTPECVRHNTTYIETRNNGYALKASYIEVGTGEKNTFLKLFSDAESMIDEDYIDYKADEASLISASSLEEYAEKRRANAIYLIEHLNENSTVHTVFRSMSQFDAPLFVPITVNQGLRDKLRSYLIENDVYCPIHWPKHNGIDNKLYDTELSLICDQRYEIAEMQREIDLIQRFEQNA